MNNQFRFEVISRVVDRYLNFTGQRGRNQYIADVVPVSMLEDNFQTEYEDIVKWKPIPSTITSLELDLFEKYLNVKLPESYIYFLQHKHFIEIGLGEYHVTFFRSVDENWLADTIAQIEEYPEEIRWNGYIPIGQFNDSGLVCFDTNGKQVSTNEYPIVWLDHEDDYTISQRLSPGFIDLFKGFEAHLDEWISAKS